MYSKNYVSVRMDNSMKFYTILALLSREIKSTTNDEGESGNTVPQTSIFGENPTDEQISLLEDITDTVGDYEERLSDTTDWKTKYEENDKEWRRRYTDRFNNTEPKPEPTPDPDPDPEPVVITTFEELFKED